ncbi:DUF4245 domain-containing protein [Actinomadura alba]|uniref:DUF4245 domain-containing protein n=2 Tax=Actinomadura alba TaxID=406431 RepID=A0ABR7LQK1_9ACTN|nr:DUF4245 domain-containing protein [Actinomadura alba]
MYKRLTTGIGGFSMAMLACLAMVGVIVLITPSSDKETLPTVDYAPHTRVLLIAAPYTSYVPSGLPARWRPTSSRVTGERGKEPIAWHLGFVTPTDEYAALEQSDERPDVFIGRMTNRNQRVGTQQIAGASWDRYFREDKRQRSLARRLPDVTLVVTGTASYEELAVLAGSLRPQKASPTPRPTST